MMDHVTTTHRIAFAVGRFALRFLAGFGETSSPLVGCLSAASWLATVQEADALVTKTWTLVVGNAPPDPVPLRLT